MHYTHLYADKTFYHQQYAIKLHLEYFITKILYYIIYFNCMNQIALSPMSASRGALQSKKIKHTVTI